MSPMNRRLDIPRLLEKNITELQEQSFALGNSPMSLSPWQPSHLEQQLSETITNPLIALLQGTVFSVDEVEMLLHLADLTAVEEMNHELFGGSNESLAEPLTMDINSVTDDSYSDSDQESDLSQSSNEANAGSRGSSPLKGAGESLSYSNQSSLVLSDEGDEMYGEEAMAESVLSPVVDINDIISPEVTVGNELNLRRKILRIEIDSNQESVTEVDDGEYKYNDRCLQIIVDSCQESERKALDKFGKDALQTLIISRPDSVITKTDIKYKMSENNLLTLTESYKSLTKDIKVNKIKLFEESLQEWIDVTQDSVKAVPGDCSKSSEISSASFSSLKVSRIETSDSRQKPNDSVESQPDSSDYKPVYSDSSFNANQLYNKPPNILVYTGENSSTNYAKFNCIKESLSLCLQPDHYAIYMLTLKEVTTVPWNDNTLLLIVSCDKVPEVASQTLSDFVLKGGNILNFCSELKLPTLNVNIVITSVEKKIILLNYKDSKLKLMERKLKYDTSDEQVVIFPLLFQEPVISELRSPTTPGVIIISQVHLELDALMVSSDEHELQELKQSNKERLLIFQDLLSSCLGMLCGTSHHHSLTPGFVLTVSTAILERFLLSTKKFSQGKVSCKDVTLHFVDRLPEQLTPSLLDDEIPVVYNVHDMKDCLTFDLQKYKSHLQTKELGQVILYFDTVSTTMDILEGFTDVSGILAIARYQTKGRGRSGNQWLSPNGCAMFTLHVSFSVKSFLGQSLPFLQHLTTLAVIQAVCHRSGYEDISLKIKWPNDIYCGSLAKIGGVLVNSSICGKTVNCFVGCGINISNSYPTICVNDLIKFHNQATGSKLEQLTIEEVLALTLTRLEVLISSFQTYGASKILPLYYSHWLHNKQEVWLEELQEKATIQGLDKYGFLEVDTSYGIVSLQPDGNSFDMMRNLIRQKK
ncbi:biotin--protein ligase-like isoform X2 [Tachypleus tridentatus]|uniref:biotin--protein ligase-like isoform X2 n=1 Tax=Tachypleus tridentatus TaxID=6853 RepID=UPI003FD0402D